MKRNLVILLALMAGLVACAARSEIRTVGQLEHQLSHSIDLFMQYSLPNSMTREPGFDLAAHLEGIDDQWKATTAVFHSADGVAFLRSRIGSESDELAVLAILKILHESKRAEAQEIFTKFTQDPRPVVSEWAKEYLSKSKWPASKE